MHEFIQYITDYLKSDQTPGAAGNIFWAAVYILLVFGGLSVAVIGVMTYFLIAYQGRARKGVATTVK